MKLKLRLRLKEGHVTSSFGSDEYHGMAHGIGELVRRSKVVN